MELRERAVEREDLCGTNEAGKNISSSMNIKHWSICTYVKSMGQKNRTTLEYSKLLYASTSFAASVLTISPSSPTRIAA